MLQALVYFAVPKKGAKPIDGKTDANPEGLTGVTGKHAQLFAERLAAGDLSCKVQTAMSGCHCLTLASMLPLRLLECAPGSSTAPSFGALHRLLLGAPFPCSAGSV